MNRLLLFITAIIPLLSASAQHTKAEDYYVAAFNEISDMLAGRDSLSIKRAVYLAEWAYYEGEIDYQKDFCDEIDRITSYVKLFYNTNKLYDYKTGKQMALNEYFFRPYSGNQYLPYTYDFDSLSNENDNWENQFVSKVLKSHKGQCRSLPVMYKILADEIGGEVSIALAPRHCYIMYKDEDHQTPEEWINLELTTHQMQPTFSIKDHFEIKDSAIIVGTYMKPLSDIETVALQLNELAMGYGRKFKRYDEFTYFCAYRSLEFFLMNPTAWLVKGKSLENITRDYLAKNGNVLDDFAKYLFILLDDSMYMLNNTYMTVETDEIREQRLQEAIEAEKYTNEKLLLK